MAVVAVVEPLEPAETTSLVDPLLWTAVDGWRWKRNGIAVVVLLLVVWCVWKITRWGEHSQSFIHPFIHSFVSKTIEYLHRWSSSRSTVEA